MNNCHFLAATEVGKLESVLQKSLRVCSSGHLQGLHHSIVDLVLDPREFSLNILSNDCDVHVVVPVGYRRERIAQIDVSEEIEVLIELMVIVILGQYTFFGYHDSKKDAFVTAEEIPLGNILKGEVLDDFKLHGHVGSLEDILHTS